MSRHASGHSRSQRSARMFIDDVTDADGGRHFKKVGRDAAIKTTQSLSLHNGAEDANGRVFRGSQSDLRLKPRADQSKRVAGQLTTRTADRATRE